MLLALVLLLQPALSEAREQGRVEGDRSVEALGADDLEVRRRAERELLDRGPSALPELLDALRHPDPEVRGRAFSLLEEMKPIDWVMEHLDHPLALDLFHACHRSHLSPNWQATLRSFMDRMNRGKGSFRDLELSARSCFPCLRVGRFQREDAEAPGFRRERIAFDLNEGGIIVGYPEDLNPSKPCCRVLLERILKDPQDRQAACLLADVIPLAKIPVLVRALGRPDAVGRAAFPLLLYLYAKSGVFPDARFLDRLEREMTDADWNLLCPASVIGHGHPKLFAPTLRRCYSSPNRWTRYLAASLAHRRQDFSFYSPGLFDVMREGPVELRSEALFAAFAIAPREEMDFKAMVGASLALVDDLDEPWEIYSMGFSHLQREAAVREFRELPDPKLGLELVRILPGERAFALAVLDVFTDSAVVDAFCAEADREPSGRYLELLALQAGRGERRPVDVIRSFVSRLDESGGLEAARQYAALAGHDSLEFFEDLLRDERPTIRRRALEGLWKLNTRNPGWTMWFAAIVEIVTRAVEAEEDPETLAFAREKLQELTGYRRLTLPREPMIRGRAFG